MSKFDRFFHIAVDSDVSDMSDDAIADVVGALCFGLGVPRILMIIATIMMDSAYPYDCEDLKNEH